jgi:hypothetical protein
MMPCASVGFVCQVKVLLLWRRRGLEVMRLMFTSEYVALMHAQIVKKIVANATACLCSYSCHFRRKFAAKCQFVTVITCIAETRDTMAYPAIIRLDVINDGDDE